jgi:hypothetical protein
MRSARARMRQEVGPTPSPSIGFSDRGRARHRCATEADACPRTKRSPRRAPSQRRSWTSRHTPATSATASTSSCFSPRQRGGWSVRSSSWTIRGPVRLEAGQGLDVRLHPQISLATVSSLGRDELGDRWPGHCPPGLASPAASSRRVATLHDLSPRLRALAPPRLSRQLAFAPTNRHFQ